MKEFEKDRESHKIINVDSIEDVTPVNNCVILKLAENNLEKKTDAGVIMNSAGFNYNEMVGRNANRKFIVVKAPEAFIPSPKERFHTTIEVQPDDVVWVSFFHSVKCPIFRAKEGDFYYMDYFALRIAKRGDEIIPLNGYVFFEDVMIPAPKTKVELVHFKPMVDVMRGKVVFVGSKLKGYLFGSKDERSADKNIDVNPGDVVIFDKPLIPGQSRPYLEYETYANFDNGKMYFYTHRKHIAGKDVTL